MSGRWVRAGMSGSTCQPKFRELLIQLDQQSLPLDHLVVTSGSGATHAGLLFGLRTLENRIGITGVCPRRNALSQGQRIAGHLEKLSTMLNQDPGIEPDDIRLTDVSLAPGYGRLNDAVRRSVSRSGLHCQNDGRAVSSCPATGDLWKDIILAHRRPTGAIRLRRRAA